MKRELISGIIGLIIGILIGKFIFNNKFTKSSSSGRSLVYYCISGDKTYIDMGILAISSLIYFLNRNDIDILIITQNSFMDTINSKLNNLKFNGNFIIKSLDDKEINPYALRLHIFDIFPEVQMYNKVLYLDSDTIVVNDKINNLFDEYLDVKNLHVFREPGVNEYNSMFTIAPVAKDHQEYLFSRNLYPFNSGTFMFCPTEDMKNHFNNVNQIRKSYPVSHYDQDYLNFYFNIQKLSTDNTTLENYIELVDCLGSTKRTSKDKAILHFYNHTGFGKFKIKAMTESYSYLNN